MVFHMCIHAFVAETLFAVRAGFQRELWHSLYNIQKIPCSFVQCFRRWCFFPNLPGSRKSFFRGHASHYNLRDFPNRCSLVADSTETFATRGHSTDVCDQETRCRRSATSCHSAIAADLQFALQIRSPNTPPTRWRDLNGAVVARRGVGALPLDYARACSNPSSYAV